MKQITLKRRPLGTDLKDYPIVPTVRDPLPPLVGPRNPFGPYPIITQDEAREVLPKLRRMGLPRDMRAILRESCYIALGHYEARKLEGLTPIMWLVCPECDRHAGPMYWHGDDLKDIAELPENGGSQLTAMAPAPCWRCSVKLGRYQPERVDLGGPEALTTSIPRCATPRRQKHDARPTRRTTATSFYQTPTCHLRGSARSPSLICYPSGNPTGRNS